MTTSLVLVPVWWLVNISSLMILIATNKSTLNVVTLDKKRWPAKENAQKLPPPRNGASERIRRLHLYCVLHEADNDFSPWSLDSGGLSTVRLMCMLVCPLPSLHGNAHAFTPCWWEHFTCVWRSMQSKSRRNRVKRWKMVPSILFRRHFFL